MKRIIRIAFLLLTLVGSLTTSVLADGSGGTPKCNPLTDPNCKTTLATFTGR